MQIRAALSDAAWKAAPKRDAVAALPLQQIGLSAVLSFSSLPRHQQSRASTHSHPAEAEQRAALCPALLACQCRSTKRFKDLRSRWMMGGECELHGGHSASEAQGKAGQQGVKLGWMMGGA